MEISVLLLHKHLKYLQDCCNLINSEWKRSDTARLRSLETSCDHLPASLILLNGDKLIGHLKLSPIPTLKEGCFVESVVIDKSERGKGYGSTLMKRAEAYCKEHLNLKVIYLSTKGQEGFYSKLGYAQCPPISIYGGFLPAQSGNLSDKVKPVTSINKSNGPKAPPLPNINNSQFSISKTYMKKEL